MWLAGCAALHAAGHPFGLVPAGVGGAVCVVASLVPDFDHPRSLASNCLPPISNLLAWATRRLSRAVYLVTATRADRRDDDAGTHRALTHTPLFALWCAVAVGALIHIAARWLPIAGWEWLGLPFGLGCLIHTLGDSCTRSGCPLLWPLRVGGQRWRRFGAPVRFTTGGVGEQVAVGLCLMVGVGALWSLYGG